MTAPATPIFVLGILARSGTNYLYELIRAHPDCAIRRPIWEDKLVRHSQLLVEYVDAVVATWDPRWNVPAVERARLLSSLGAGLQQFVSIGADRSHVVVKTPSVENLPLFFDVIPDAPAIVLTRDGRSVTESGVRSFGWNYPLTMKQWAEAGRTILSAEAAFHDQGHRYRRVRYEDLIRDLRAELTGIFETCGLDPARYDFAAAAKTPVRGSSTVRPDAAGPVDWAHVDRPDDFDPVQRFADWDDALHHLYAELAGAVHTDLGYRLDPLPPMTPAVRAQLVRYHAELAAKLGQRSVRRMSGRARGVLRP